MLLIFRIYPRFFLTLTTFLSANRQFFISFLDLLPFSFLYFPLIFISVILLSFQVLNAFKIRRFLFSLLTFQGFSRLKHYYSFLTIHFSPISDWQLKYFSQKAIFPIYYFFLAVISLLYYIIEFVV